MNTRHEGKLLATLFRKSEIVTPKVEDPVKKASTFTRVAVPQPELIDKLLEEVNVTDRHMKSYLPVEASGRREAEDRLTKTKSVILSEQRIKEMVGKVGPRWQILDPQPLSWRNTITNMPTFGIFPISDPDGLCVFTLEMKVVDGGSGNHNPNIQKMKGNCPEVYLESYKMLEEFLQEKISSISNRKIYNRIFQFGFGKGSVILRLGASFAGVIPPHVRKEIALAQETGLQDICIIAEVPEWSFSEEYKVDPTSKMTARPSRQGDPLVVGHDGSNFWLISVFDTTTIEQLVADEFATRS